MIVKLHAVEFAPSTFSCFILVLTLISINAIPGLVIGHDATRRIQLLLFRGFIGLDFIATTLTLRIGKAEALVLAIQNQQRS